MAFLYPVQIYSIDRRHKVFLFFFFFGGGGGGGGVHHVVVFLFFSLVNFARCWDLGELSSAAGVNTYHIMHSPCNTIPPSLSAAGRRLTM